MKKAYPSSASAKLVCTASCTEHENGSFAWDDGQRMTSLEIAEITQKPHNDVMKAIRRMEPAWVKVTQGNFSLSTYKDSTGRTLPCYSLNKFECLYIATKFNDEARARLVKRWAELEAYVAEQTRLEIEENREMANYCRESLQSISSFPVRTIAHVLGMTAQQLNKLLCQMGIQYGQSGSYVPYAPYARKGLTKSRTYNRKQKDGTVVTTHRTTWTEAGIKFIIENVKEMRQKTMPRKVFVQLTFQFC